MGALRIGLVHLGRDVDNAGAGLESVEVDLLA